MKKINFIFQITIILILIFLLLNPQKYIQVSLNGIIVWATLLLPALFPFIFFTKILSKFEIIDWLSQRVEIVTRRLYNCPGWSSYIFVMSIFSGYPIGAKLTADLYYDNKITKGQALRTITFTSNSGPMFIVGTVGVSMLISTASGIVIFISHIIGSVLNGLIYRSKFKNEDIQTENFCKTQKQHNNKKIEKNEDLIDMVYSSVMSILGIGAYVCIFFIISEIVLDLNIFLPIQMVFEKIGISSNFTSSILSGFIEITKGCFELSQLNLTNKIIVPICTFIISFGGISTFLQSYTFLSKIKIKATFFIIQKLTHAVISLVISIILSVVIF